MKRKQPEGAAFLRKRRICGGRSPRPAGTLPDPKGVGRRRFAPEASPRTECGQVQTEGKRDETKVASEPN